MPAYTNCTKFNNTCMAHLRCIPNSNCLDVIILGASAFNCFS